MDYNLLNNDSNNDLEDTIYELQYTSLISNENDDNELIDSKNNLDDLKIADQMLLMLDNEYENCINNINLNKFDNQQIGFNL